MRKAKMIKRQFVARLAVADRVDDLFIVQTARRAYGARGEVSLLVTLMDRTGTLVGVVRENFESYGDLFAVAHIVRVVGTVVVEGERKELRIEHAEQVSEKDVELLSLLPASPKNREDMAFDLQKIVHSVENSYLRKLLLKFFKKGKRWSRFQSAPAAKGIHHAYVGGLLEHTLSVSQLADQLAGHYDSVDSSLLLAGALLHDIGRLEEIVYDSTTISYTTVGRLKGHLILGCESVAAAASEIQDFPEELLEQLQHLILSHHGRKEYGSPALPMTPEALLLAALDDLDAKMNIVDQLSRQIESGTVAWTEYQRVLERTLFLRGVDSGPKRIEYDEDDPACRQQSLF